MGKEEARVGSQPNERADGRREGQKRTDPGTLPAQNKYEKESENLIKHLGRYSGMDGRVEERDFRDAKRTQPAIGPRAARERY
jgi:hypothetical protein